MFMTLPTSKLEESLKQKGYLAIAGIDEAGRGAWAGPLVAAACILPEEPCHPEIRDSKELSQKKREDLHAWLMENCISTGVGLVESFEIDLFGMTQATQLAFRRALSRMKSPCDYILCDAFELTNSRVPSEGIIKGDQKVMTIAAASIVAKVERDAIMCKYAEEFPGYGFEQHKGYGTSQHIENIRRFGVLKIHRKLFLQKFLSSKLNA